MVHSSRSWTAIITPALQVLRATQVHEVQPRCFRHFDTPALIQRRLHLRREDATTVGASNCSCLSNAGYTIASSSSTTSKNSNSKQQQQQQAAAKRTSIRRYHTFTVKMECDREENWFICVSEVARRRKERARMVKISSGD